ncbi:MAG: RNA methyltransferase [Bacteroidia bacterium]
MPRKLKNIELQRLSVEEFKDAPKLPIKIVLDNVRSMNNVGSVFRTGDAFRIDHIYLCGITPTPPHRDITKTAIGAENTVDWLYEKDVLNCIKTLQSEGYTIFGIEQTDQSTVLNKIDFNKFEKIALVFGNEIDGLHDDIVNECNYLIEIPQIGTKHSINVSVCAGILMWEAAKTKLK